MIEIVFGERLDPAKYIAFCREVYTDKALFRDSGLTNVLGMIFYRRELMPGNAAISPLMVNSNGELQAACLLMVAQDQPGALQISYFEARENCQAAVDLLVDTARALCRKKGLDRIVIGLDNMVGILIDHFDSPSCYGTRYNPAYYPDYFSKYHAREHLLTSYLIDLNRYSLAREQKILNRIGARFTCRTASWRRLGQETGIYTDLKNRCFTGQPFFALGSPEMNYQMFSSYRSLLSGQNLLILERDGAPAGYLLWFPDYNQLLKPGEVLSPETIRKYRFYGRAIDRFIITEIGVLPEYQGTGAILALFKKCLELTRGQYDWCETGWILDSNIKSKGFGIRWGDAEYKHYKIYELEA
ncbi:MAG: hypothetical protein ABSC17_07015 [Thermacetogeniaceae bacterium]